MSDKCPWCGEGQNEHLDPGVKFYGCGSWQWANGDGGFHADQCRDNERNQLQARIAEMEAELSRLRENPRTDRTCHKCKISIGACDATVSEGERHYHAMCKVAERADAAEAELSRLRSRLGEREDDATVLTDEWLTATLGDAWIIEVENGKLNIMDERPGDDEDEEQELAAWFQMVGRHDMVCVRPKIKTRGDVRRLVAALGEREGGE